MKKATWRSHCQVNPDPEEVKRKSVFAGKLLRNLLKNPKTLINKPYELKRKFIEHCFDGKDSDGNPLGVYITWNANGKYQIEIRGLLDSTILGWREIQDIRDDHIISEIDLLPSLRRNPMAIM